MKKALWILTLTACLASYANTQTVNINRQTGKKDGSVVIKGDTGGNEYWLRVSCRLSNGKVYEFPPGFFGVNGRFEKEFTGNIKKAAADRELNNIRPISWHAVLWGKKVEKVQCSQGHNGTCCKSCADYGYHFEECIAEASTGFDF